MDAFWQFARLMMQRYRSGLVIALIFAGISGIGFGAGLLGVGPVLKVMMTPDEPRSLIDLANERNADPETFIAVPDWVIAQLPSDPFDGVVFIIVGLMVLSILGATTNFLHQFISQTITTRAVAEIRREAFEAVLQMPLARVIERGPSEFVARLIRDAAELQRGLIALVSRSVTQIIRGLFGLAAAFIVDWQLTVVAAIVAPVAAIVLRTLGKRIRRGTRGSLYAQEGLLRVATECVQGLRAVKVNCGEQESVERFEAINADVVHNELRVRTARAFSSPLVELLAVAGVFAIILATAKQILDGAIQPDQFLLFLLCMGVAGAAIKPLTSFVNEMYAAAAPATRLADLMREELENDGDDTRPDLATHTESIAFEGVTFTYPRAEHPALDGATFTVSKNERVAIVGPNGCGKTTLLSMLPRLLEPNSGTIRIDGVDLSTVNRRSIRRQMGVVTQETVLFRGTVAENISFGMGTQDRERVIEAAKQAHAHSFITEMPNGYDTNLAELGASLSGGQRQRLAIARAVLRDPAILIMDEATSQIDAESEQQINDAISEFCCDRTALIIAHRLSTVLSCDRIVVMDGGAVVDGGTHDELLQRCPTYQRISRTQLAT